MTEIVIGSLSKSHKTKSGRREQWLVDYIVNDNKNFRDSVITLSQMTRTKQTRTTMVREVT